MSRNDDSKTGNVLDYLYYQNYYKLIAIDFSRQTNMSITQQTNFVARLEEDDAATMFLIAEKRQKTILSFSSGSQNNINNGTSKIFKFIEWNKQC